MAGFPASLYGSGQQDPVLGGTDPSTGLGFTQADLNAPIRGYIDNQILELQRQGLLYGHWPPYKVQHGKVITSCVAGDMLVENLSGTDPKYSLGVVGKTGFTYNIDTTPRVGMVLEPASAGVVTAFITEGPGIPPNIHGVDAAGVGGNVVMNTTTGRLAVSTGAPGEIVVGTINTRNYVRLFPRTASEE